MDSKEAVDTLAKVFAAQPHLLETVGICHDAMTTKTAVEISFYIHDVQYVVDIYSEKGYEYSPEELDGKTYKRVYLVSLRDLKLVKVFDAAYVECSYDYDTGAFERIYIEREGYFRYINFGDKFSFICIQQESES